MKALRCERCGRFMSAERGYPPIEETHCEDCANRDPRVWHGNRFIRESEAAWLKRQEAR